MRTRPDLHSPRPFHASVFALHSDHARRRPVLLPLTSSFVSLVDVAREGTPIASLGSLRIATGKLGWNALTVQQLQTSSRDTMMHDFKIGDHVSWNSEAGRISGTIIRVHTSDFKVKGYTHHASADAPQYEIKSSKTEHIAFHKGSALSKLGD